MFTTSIFMFKKRCIYKIKQFFLSYSPLILTPLWGPYPIRVTIIFLGLFYNHYIYSTPGWVWQLILFLRLQCWFVELCPRISDTFIKVRMPICLDYISFYPYEFLVALQLHYSRHIRKLSFFENSKLHINWKKSTRKKSRPDVVSNQGPWRGTFNEANTYPPELASPG